MSSLEETLRAIREKNPGLADTVQRVAGEMGVPIANVVACKVCGAKNRLAPGKQYPRCGRCKDLFR